MREIKEIAYATEEYAKTLALRNKVMRIPLGLNIYEEDFSSELTSSNDVQPFNPAPKYVKVAV